MPELAATQKHILVICLAGGLSQLESWDPKPKTDTGGPFRAIPTSVPGTHISELLPYTAKQMHHLAIVRSVNTKEDDHGKGALLHDDRPAAGAGRRLSAPGRRRRQAARAGELAAAGPHSHFARAAAAARATTRPSSVRSTPASRWATASRRKTRPGPRA